MRRKSTDKLIPVPKLLKIYHPQIAKSKMIISTKMLPSIECINFKPNIVIIVVVLLLVNIPFIVTQNDDKPILNKRNEDHAVPSKTYEEFYIEHAISKKEAKQKFQENYKTLMQGKNYAFLQQ